MRITSPESLANFIRDRRQTQKLSQTCIAENIGSQQKTISQFENRPANSKVETLFRLLSELELNLHLYHREKDNTADDWKHEW